MSTEIISKAISKAIAADSPTLDGFTASNLPQAAKYRLARLAKRGSFDGEFDWETELPVLDALHIEPTETYTERPAAQDPWSYLVFADGSLYYSNNAADEVWADASDFIKDELINAAGKDASDYEPDSAEGRLIRAHAAYLL